MNENERRKQQLVTEGFAYRLRVSAAAHHVKEGLHPDVLSHSAIGMLTKTALGMVAGGTALRGLGSLGSSLGGLGGMAHTALPLLMSGAKMLAKRTVGRPIVRGLLLAAVAGGAAFFIIKKRNAAADEV